MTADALSQEEIDALLKGAGSGGSGPTSSSRSAVSPPSFSSRQIAGASEYAGKMATTQGEMIGTFLATTARSEGQDPVPQTSEGVADIVMGPVAMAKFSHKGPLHGASVLVFRQADAAKIGGTMVGDPAATEFSDMVADAFKEVVNTVLGNLNTSLSAKAGGPVSVTSLVMETAESDADSFSSALGGDEQLLLVPYRLAVGDSLDTECWQLFSMELARSLDVLGAPVPAPEPPGQALKAAPVEFESLTDEPPTAAPPNLDLIMDIGLEVRVELGRTHMKIKDVLNLGGGSVVELDKLAGEPVDLLVNDVIFAKGEVVVIDENFGVRITDILSLNDRIKTLGERAE
jgi:flagellar motor switch protein FliN/FliY